MKFLCKTLFYLPLLFVFSVCSNQVPTQTDNASDLVFYSQNNLFSIKVLPQTSPFKLNTLQRLSFELYDKREHMINNADVIVEAGMPEHRHGMPTAPHVVLNQAGHYQILGLKFQMQGYWLITLTVNQGTQRDTVELKFHIKPTQGLALDQFINHSM